MKTIKNREIWSHIVKIWWNLDTKPAPSDSNIHGPNHIALRALIALWED